ncbi:MAG: alpha/beta fold hydrolase [Nocardioidaceae bacterium]
MTGDQLAALRREARAVTAALGGGFTSATAQANGTTLHYVRGGQGPPLVLLHGFPQDWYEWRQLLPRLAERYTVLAVDQRGVGGSEAPPGGYAAAELAEDIHQLVAGLGLAPIHAVGHDIGGWVAYALARLHPEAVRTALVLETLLPGITTDTELEVPVSLWHGEFHMIPDLPEALVTDRQAIYFRHFFDIGTTSPEAITDDDVRHYANAYGDAEHLRSAFEVYRAIPANIELNAQATGAIDIPLCLAGGKHVFGPALPALAAGLRGNHGWSNVTVAIISGGRHYLPDERPDDVADLIEQHAALQ